jgi:repressor LexA
MKELTERQKAVLAFINSYIDSHRYPPTIREIAERFSISVKGAYDHMKALEKKGSLRLEGNRSRALEIIGKSEPRDAVVQLHLLGEVAAGKPITAEENWEKTVDVPSYMARGKPCFALKVKGDSMKDAGIMNGDIAVIESQPTAENGEIVVALIEDQVTIKRFYREANRVRLQPENEAYKPTFYQEIKILGRLQGILRTYA